MAYLFEMINSTFNFMIAYEYFHKYDSVIRFTQLAFKGQRSTIFQGFLFPKNVLGSTMMHDKSCVTD